MATLDCFIIMPFRDEFDEVCAAVQEAARSVSEHEVEARWLKDAVHPGNITDEIVGSLTSAAFCVADLTGCNPNVMWEAGFAMALGRPTILIAQRVRELPFDLRTHRVLEYELSDLPALAELLRKAIPQTLARYALPASRAQPLPPKAPQTIVVTGTAHVDPVPVRRRVETYLAPYCAGGAVWYCGTTGTVDEAALDYLVAKGETVVAVAYHAFDFSAGVRRHVEANSVQFVDATAESLPKGLPGPSDRDRFFCSRGDLVVLFWDGESRGTAELIRYFQDQGRSLLVSFI